MTSSDDGTCATWLPLSNSGLMRTLSRNDSVAASMERGSAAKTAAATLSSLASSSFSSF
jgi:hypothetical protein